MEDSSKSHHHPISKEEAALLNTNHIAGVSIDDLVQKYGSPLYVYDLESIRSQYLNLVKAFGGFKHQIHYAVKANSSMSILKFISSLGASVDTVSVAEIKCCLQAGFRPENIVFTPSGPSPQDLEFAINNSIIMVLDNKQVIEWIGKTFKKPIDIAIRLNPLVFTGGDDKISVAGENSKFGMDSKTVEEVKTICKQYGLNIVGVHIHTGSDISDKEKYMQAIDFLVKIAIGFDSLKFVDLGSGFKVSYHSGDKKDKDTNLEEYSKDIHSKLQCLIDKFDLQVKFEPGKYIVGKSGYLITTAEVVKEANGHNFVIVDSGLNHLIRPMMYSKAFHYIHNASNLNGAHKKYNVCGYVCETDNFGLDRDLSEVRPGDKIIIHNAGAYGFTMASNYNLRCRPAEVAIKDKNHFLIRQRESFEDILKHQLIINFEGATEEERKPHIALTR